MIKAQMAHLIKAQVLSNFCSDPLPVSGSMFLPPKSDPDLREWKCVWRVTEFRCRLREHEFHEVHPID